MTFELEKKLYDKYPKIFKQKDQDKRTTAMCWGMACNDGWYDLIDQLCQSLQFDIDHNNHPQIEATQVKEKFGSLRFYTNTSDDRQDGMIDFVETMSEHICEDCGTNKDVTQDKGGWIRTLCKTCRKEID